MKEIMAAIILAGLASGAVQCSSAPSTPSIRSVVPKRGAVVIDQHGAMEQHVSADPDAKKNIVPFGRSENSAVFIGPHGQFARRGVAKLEASAAVSMPVTERYWTAPFGLNGDAEQSTPYVRTAVDQLGEIEKQTVADLGAKQSISRFATSENGSVVISQHGQFARQGVAELEVAAMVQRPPTPSAGIMVIGFLSIFVCPCAVVFFIYFRSKRQTATNTGTVQAFEVTDQYGTAYVVQGQASSQALPQPAVTNQLQVQSPVRAPAPAAQASSQALPGGVQEAPQKRAGTVKSSTPQSKSQARPKRPRLATSPGSPRKRTPSPAENTQGASRGRSGSAPSGGRDGKAQRAVKD